MRTVTLKKKVLVDFLISWSCESSETSWFTEKRACRSSLVDCEPEARKLHLLYSIWECRVGKKGRRLTSKENLCIHVQNTCSTENWVLFVNKLYCKQLQEPWRKRSWYFCQFSLFSQFSTWFHNSLLSQYICLVLITSLQEPPGLPRRACDDGRWTAFSGLCLESRLATIFIPKNWAEILLTSVLQMAQNVMQ
jgi:hypothetical protein